MYSSLHQSSERNRSAAHRVFLFLSCLFFLYQSASGANNTCANATALALSTTTSGSISASGSITTYFSNGCNIPDPTCTCNKYESWYKFTTTITGVYTITVTGNGTVNSGFDPVVEFRSGACNGTIVSGVDNTGRAATETITTATLPAATQYYIRVYAYHCNDVLTKTFSIRVDPPACSPPTATAVTASGTYCGQTTVLASGGTGGTIYFQGTTSGGTSTATPATAQIVTASGTYYFNSFNGTCWGQEGSATVTITQGPCLQWLNQNCTLGTGSYIDGGTISPTENIQTVNTAANTGNYGYIFWTFNASKDSTYYFDLCSSTGTAMSWLRLHDGRTTGNNYCMDGSNTPTRILENIANGCTGTGTGLSKLIWTCQKSGTYYLESAGDYLTYWGVQSNQTATLSYKTLPSFSFISSDVFFDKGIDGTDGSTSSYNNNEDWIYTYYCTDTVGSAISAQFISFSTAPGDVLCVYNGNSINAPIIGCYSGPSITGTFSSTATDGSLTFQFTSDDTNISGGWEANVSCMENVGVRTVVSENKIGIFPNPVQDKLVVNIQSSAMGRIAVYNVLGENVYPQLSVIRTSGTTQLFDASALASGVYIVRLEDEKGNLIGRFVKQ